MTDSETRQVPVILWHPDGQKVALQGSDLPVLEVKRHAAVRKVVKELWNVDAWPLEDAGISFGLAGTPRLLALSDELPPHLSWEVKDVAPLPFEQVWQRPDWLNRMRTRLEQAGVNASDIKPVHSLDLTSIVHVTTPDGDIYLKTSSTPDEMRFTQYVAGNFPDLTPPLLACNTEEDWQVTASGGQLLDAVADLSACEQAVTRLIKFQRAADAPALAKMGARSFPLNEMQERIPEFLENTALLSSWGSSEEQIMTLQDALPTIRNAFAALMDLGLPDLPAHGNAHPRNALHGERGSVWFDWSETLSAAHPFMDLGWFLGFVLHPARENLPVRQAHPGLETHLTRSILQVFNLPEKHAPRLNAAIPLAYLHRAVVYGEKFRNWQGNIPNWRPNYVPFYLRQAVRELGRFSV